MWKENLYQPIEVLLREHDHFPIGQHQHSFFEITYILEGEGKLCIYPGEKECKTFGYHPNSLFLVPPNTTHYFTISTHSRYIFIRFTEYYISDYIGRFIHNILNISSDFNIQLAGEDQEIIDKIAQLVRLELVHRKNLSEHLLQNHVNNFILVIARNLSPSSPNYNEVNNNKAQYLLQYLQQHIHEPELLRTRALAAKFHLSPTYVGRFFKHHFGEDLQLYVSKNRLRKIEEMLINSRMTIKEIANQMGLPDSCYLNKLFQRYHRQTPLQFRKEHINSTIPMNE